MIEVSGKGWKVVHRRSGSSTFEIFTSPKGEEYVRCQPGEEPDAIHKSKTRGLPDTFLKLASASRAVRRADRRERRRKRELRARGYDA